MWITLAAVGFLALQYPLRNYFVDDAYIHLTFARSIAAGEGFCFNPGEPTYGVTAPLWTLLLAVVGLGFGVTPTSAKCLSVLFGVLTIPAMHRLARKLGLSVTGAVSVTLIWAIEVWAVRWAASGMETSLALLLLLLAFSAQLTQSPIAGMYLGLAALCRPETAPLVVVFALDSARAAGWKRGLTVLLIAVVVLLPWLLYAAFSFGSIIPNPAQVKGLGLPPLTDFISGLKRVVAIIGGAHFVEVTVICAGIIWALKKRLAVDSENARRAGLLLVWAIFLPIVLLAQDVFISSRYLVIGLPPLTLGAFLILGYWMRGKITVGALKYGKLITVIIIALQLTLTGLVTIPHARSFGSTMAALQELADYLKKNTSPNVSVAVADVGVIGYSSGRRVIDLEGLVTPAMISHRTRGDYDSLIATNYFLKVERPDYLIDRSRTPERFGKQSGGLYLPLLTIPVKGGRVDTGNEVWYYTLYAVADSAGKPKGLIK